MDTVGSDTAAAADVRPGSRKSYDAFISYAHDGDEVFAPILQRGLQHLAKPWNRRCGMEVFRDETSLAVSPGLWPSIRNALDVSRWLVVLASPEAAQSHWVGEEITHWVSSKGPDHLLVIITDGTWIWDDDSDDLSPASTACPPALGGVFPAEPKYLDMTWARRDAGLTLRNARFRDQIATLAAAIREIPKEEMEGEDVRQQRRTHRIVQAVIATLTILVLLASALAVLFYVERRVAIHQTQEAIQQRDMAISGELVSDSEAVGGTNATVSQLESIAAWSINPSAQARYAMLSAAASPEIATLTAPNGAHSVAFSPDGKTLATVGADGIAVWNAVTRRQISSFPAGSGGADSVAFSPDGKMLATADDGDGTARVWNLATSRQITSFHAATGAVFSLAFSPDGKTLATGYNDGTAKLWNLATSRQITSILADSGSNGVWSVAFSPDGKTLATGDGDGTARVWNLATRRLISSFPAGATGLALNEVNSVAFSPDGKTLATGDTDGTAKLWNLATRRQITSILADSGFGGVQSLAFSPDGKTLATGGANGTALWNSGSGRQIGTPFTALGFVDSVAFSPDGKTLITGDADNTVRVWDVATSRQLGSFPATENGAYSSVAFSPDGKTLAISNGGGTVQLWNVPTGQPVRTLTTSFPNILNVAFSSDGKILATGDDNGTAELWNVASGQQIRTLTSLGASNVYTVAFSPDGKTLATGDDNGTARLWNLATGQQIRAMTFRSDSPILLPIFNSVAFSPDGKMLATGDTNGTARLWNVATGRQVRAMTIRSFSILSVAFSPDGKTLATGDNGGLARLWNVATGQQTKSLTTGSSTVYSVAFSPDGKTLATGDDDNTARLWDLATERQIGGGLTDSGSIQAVAFSPDGKTLATEDGPARLWDVGYLIDALTRLCSQVGGSLSQAEWTRYVPPGPPYQNICALHS